MSTPGTEVLIDEEEIPEGPAPLAPPLWAPRLAIAGRSFIVIGMLIVLGVIVTDPVGNLEVFCAGVTLAVAGAVLRAIATPVAAR